MAQRGKVVASPSHVHNLVPFNDIVVSKNKYCTTPQREGREHYHPKGGGGDSYHFQSRWGTATTPTMGEGESSTSLEKREGKLHHPNGEENGFTHQGEREKQHHSKRELGKSSNLQKERSTTQTTQKRRDGKRPFWSTSGLSFASGVGNGGRLW